MKDTYDFDKLYAYEVIRKGKRILNFVGPLPGIFRDAIKVDNKTETDTIVQIIDNQIVAAFSKSDIVFARTQLKDGVRNV